MRPLCPLIAGVPLAAFALLGAVAVGADSAPEQPPQQPLRIEVLGSWGTASRADVQKVVESAAAQLLCHCPQRRLKPILIRQNKNGPIVLDEKAADGQYQVGLNTQDTYWCQYAYQFAHELGHVLCNYDRRKRGKNLWFEEAVCETASLLALKGMAVAWKSNPPYPNWRDFSGSLDNYVNRLLAESDRRLPPDKTMAVWLGEHQTELRSERQLSERSKLVAAYLLTLFEQDPHTWAALEWLNLGADDAEFDFGDYLSGWINRVPEEHRPRVQRIRTLFGFPPATPPAGQPTP